MIHVFIGTKAQFIKTVPVIQELQKRDIEFNFIDTGQHASITKKIRKLFNIKNPDVFLRDNETDITKVSVAIIWFAKLFLLSLFKKKKIFNDIFQGKTGICIIHGDTLSTLLSLFLAKRVGIKVAHIEAGLRSFNYINPFPEEIIRIISMKFSDLLFAPSDIAYRNLYKMQVKGKIFNTKSNTVYDAIQIADSNKLRKGLPQKPYVVLTAHRFENIYSKARMHFIFETVQKVKKNFNVIFVLHSPTEKNLERYDLLEQFRQICSIMPMQEYFDFLHLLKESEFVMTDGGSIQEECYYLGIPCLLLRMKTERNEGINKNVYISKFNEEIVDRFLKKYKELSFDWSNNVAQSPSAIIVDRVICFK